MFEVRELSKQFGVTRALDSVSLDFQPGKVTALLGENGAGKSTLLGILAGLVPPSSGAIYRDGKPLQLRSPRDARNAGIKIIPQQPDIVEGLTVAENIFLGLLPTAARVFRRQAAYETCEDLISRHGLERRIDGREPAAKLTASGRQLVEILRAVVARPQLVAFDEPTSALGHEEVEQLRKLIGEMKHGGAAVVYVSHRRAEIEDLADRIAVLRDGRLVGKHEDAAGVHFDTLITEMAGRKIADTVTHRSHARRETPVLAVKQLSTRKLRGVSFTVNAGEILGVAGLGGSGRSELARALVGAQAVTDGRIMVDGSNVAGTFRGPRQSSIGYVPEDRHLEGLVLTRSVRENIALASLADLRRMRVVRRAREREMVQRLVQELNIRCSSPDAPITSLSGGNQQKVVLARNLALKPRLWVLDEPTKGIDIATKEAFYQLIENFAESGAATVLVSSELPELTLLCDRVLVLRRGELVADVPRAELSEDRLVAAMFGELSTVTTVDNVPAEASGAVLPSSVDQG